MADKKNTRKWVVRAIVAFLAILLILTFFSNTIMNATIPKVVAENAVWGNLSSQTTATATIDIENKTKYKVPKELEGRKVESVEITNYDDVFMGDVCIKLVASDEDNEELQSLIDAYDQALKDKGYEDRLPNHGPDYTSYEQTISAASTNVNDAQTTLNQAQNKEGTIAAAQQVIADNQPLLIASQAEVASISDTIEDYETELAEIENNIGILEIIVDPAYLEDNVPEEGFTTPPEVLPEFIPDPENPDDPEAVIPNPDYVAPSDNPGLPPPAVGSNEEKLWGYYADRDALLPLLDSARERLTTASAESARLQGLIDEAQGIIDAASNLPSVSQAQADLSSANASLSQAQQTLSDQKINDSIDSDKKADADAKRDQDLLDQAEKIAKLQESLAITEICAPADGMIFDLQVNEGDILTQDMVLFNVIPDTSERVCVASFTFTTEQSKSFYVGMELTPQNGWYSSCQVVSIKPSEADPRNTRVVKCVVSGDYIYPGEEITVLAAKSNKNYENIVPSSAVNTDNSGTFVYALVEESTPLGTKYTVKRIDVEIEDTDGSRTAIKSDKLKEQNYQFITRSEVPLQDGDRVRLQDYSKSDKKEQK